MDAGEFADAVERDLGGVVEVVDDDDAEALLEELQHGVAADVSRAARHQDRPHQRRHHLPLFLCREGNRMGWRREEGWIGFYGDGGGEVRGGS